MDPITTAITAALTTGFVTGASKVGEQIIIKIYTQLKEILMKKFGAKSAVIKAVKELETKPTSPARREVLKEEIRAIKADQDPELLSIARELLKTIKNKPGGEQIIQTAMGDHNIQVTGVGNTTNVNTPKQKR